jgi:hypothetical protein
MPGQFKPVVFEPYGARRGRWRLPRWFVLLLGGIALGAGGVIVIQERYLPPRLSADESSKLRSAFEKADAEGVRLKGELGETVKRLETALSDTKGLRDELAASRATTERLRDDVASAIASLPIDPRGGIVAVRSGQFTANRGTLTYDVVLTRDRAGARPMTGVMQLVVAGESARGTESTVTLKPVELSIGAHEIVRGSLPLPDGFRPRQVTIQVLDRVAGKSLGLRVMLVK